ncbi:hypothetical protein AB9P05_16750 [Roseivirga sp. BDSF3-8]|uniref:hypothetical protein n=1 Tax=Roseivirga sp. BDSF3-8 TaxID=3241598 RepID=UPI003531AFBF
MKTSMLEYCKLILSKVCFDKRLFWKEYRKSHRFLGDQDASILREWVREKYFSTGKKQTATSHAA